MNAESYCFYFLEVFYAANYFKYDFTLACRRGNRWAYRQRTHILVYLGACMTSMTSAFVSDILGNNGYTFRIPAQAVSGIGFFI